MFCYVIYMSGNSFQHKVGNMEFLNMMLLLADADAGDRDSFLTDTSDYSWQLQIWC
jgi:hypothetical protein